MRATKSNTSSKPAKYGEKMIEVKVRFWTNNLAPKRGHILPGHAWSNGVVRMDKNELHGINPGKRHHFHSLMEIPAAIEKVLIQHGIILHQSRKSRKYNNAGR